MDRRITRSMAALGLGCLAAASGCQSFTHRTTVPPAPKSSREEAHAQFNSDPKPTQSAMGGMVQPTGPIANTMSPMGSSGLYGKGRGSGEVANMPIGDPPATAASTGSRGTPGDAPPPF